MNMQKLKFKLKLILNIPVVLLVFVLFLQGCAGYKFVQQRNPLERYGIKSITIPMFLNKSLIPGINGHFTREISRMLSEYPGLKIYGGENKKADAILLGIVSSPQKRRLVYRPISLVETEGDRQDAIGDRRAFAIPTSNTVHASLKVILVRNPNLLDIELIKSSWFDLKRMKHPKIILSEVYDVTFSAVRENKARGTSRTNYDSAELVNFTRNIRTIDKQAQAKAVSVAESLKVVLLNVF